MFFSNDKKKIAIILGGLIILFFGINFSIEFATDTYATFQETNTWQWMLYSNGRIISGLVYYAIETIGLSNGVIYHLSYMLAIVCLWAAMFLLVSLLRKYIANIYLCILLAFFTIVNPFFIEYFLFIEKGLFMLAILCSVIAFAAMEKFFRLNSMGQVITAMLCIAITVNIYQIIAALFVLLCMPVIIKRAKTIKEFFYLNIIVATIYGCNIGISYIVTKFLFNSSRLEEAHISLKSIYWVIKRIFEVTVNKFYHMQRGQFCLLLLIGAMAVILCILFDKRYREAGTYLAVVYLLIGNLFVSFFPYFMGISGSYESRIIYPYGCMIGIFLTWSCMDMHQDAKKNIVVAALALSFMVCAQYLKVQDVFIDRYRCNQADQYLCEIIGEAINKYETQNDIEVEYICFYKDQSVTWYDHGYESSELNVRAQSCGWSRLNSLNYYLDKNFIETEGNKKYFDYFQEFNWDTYCEDQLIFEEDTLHICIY